MYDKKDDFWDIDKLVPKKEKSKYVRPRHDTEAVEISIDPKAQEENSVLCRTIPPREPQSAPRLPELEYSPVSPLISSVKIYREKSGYGYYGQFCEDAERVAKLPPEEAEHVPFFSYVPQFCQLSRAQLAFYVHFRERVFRGEYIKADFSYILLLIYEIINRGALADVYEGQRALCGIYKNYREEYPRLSRSLCSHICDYSLIHRLPPPEGFLELGIPEDFALKEFFVYYDDSRDYAKALMNFCSAYDYKKSKFAKGDALSVFDTHIVGALSYVLGKCSESGKILSAAALEDSTVTREAYAGALCAFSTRRRIDVSYCSFSRSHELRFLIADIIKYSENKIRAALGIKSRLGVYSVPDNIRAVLDEYFAEALGRTPRVSKKTEREEYEKLYDAPKTELSLKNAEDIENSSWRVTKLLVEAFAEEEPDPIAPEPQSCEGDLRSALGEKYEFLSAALSANAKKQKEIASRLGKMPDVLADEINEVAAELLGDIVLEDIGGYYSVVEDYKELI